MRACIVDALLLNIVYFFGGLLSQRFAPYPSVVAWMIVQSLYLSLSFFFLFSDLLVPSLRLLIHYLATGLVFWLTCVLPGGYLKVGVPADVSFPVCIVVYTCLYAAAAAVIALVRRFSAGSEEKEQPDAKKAGKSAPSEYKSQFAAGEWDRTKKGRG